ncbi:protein transport protein Sec16B-like isoform X2 [Neopelma chrysocephalum]|uniref:protein transport protein Sec16B-like isoform X2 n=1 Tax=Neopelma chrysocephalum TaxID=114329 RepID=UPI000FCD0E50|nr:protein transport protein Sec16B-like isoform X2 [Neopelma chrysocephalum]
MDPRAPARPPQPRERPPTWGAWAEGHHGPPSPLRRQLLRAGHSPRPGSWDGSHVPGYPREEGHPPRRDTRRRASGAEHYGSTYPSQPYSRQGYEDPHWQYPAASYRDDYPYQSHQRQPVAWQGDRDPRQGEPYGKSTSYRDQHYYRGYHPNLATGPPGQDRRHSYGSHEESYTSAARREGAGGETLGSNAGEAGGQPQEPSLLLQYHESGLSSSSHELSQYIRDGADQYDPVLPGSWNVEQTGGPLVPTPTPAVPLKFSRPHTSLCFGAGGHLVLARPHHPAEGQLAHVELHSLEAILHGTKELEELQAFPGPLAREDLHKVDVMTFCQQKITVGCDPSTQRGRDSALLWKLLVLLCRQNGSMVGSDTAELLMQDCRREEKYKRQEPAANLVGLTDDEWASRQPGTLDLITGEVPPVVETQAQIVEKFTKLLYYGRKKDALVWAMRNQLWGHALFLSSKMDPRTYSWVLTGFTSTLATNDPLQTLFQLMSGRIPQAALCCGDAMWGDWRPHLAVMLSNKVGDMELNHRAIVTMGDTLASKGAVEAAHFCYLMADIPFGYFGNKAARMALLGSSHRQVFAQFASTEAIQRMEIFEYCQQLRQPESFLLPFQVYKLLYASRLADHGLPAQALQYCEHISTVLLCQDPATHPVLAQQVMKLAERLKLSDPLLLEMPEQDQTLEPDWLEQLRACCREREVEDDLPPEVVPAQPELSCAVPPTADGEPVSELPRSEGYQYDPWSQSVPPQGPSSQEDVSPWSPAPAQPAESPLLSAGQELQPPTSPPGTGTPPGGGFAEPPPQPVLPAGEAGEPWDDLLCPRRVQPAFPAEQEELQTRTRTVSETSTVSLDDSHPSSESEDAAQEEVEKPDEDKSSGFRWFGWFRSKPTKETSPKAASETDSDSPTLEQQERTSPSLPDAPLTAGTNPLAQPLSRNPGGTQVQDTFGFSPVSLEVTGSQDGDGGQSAGQQPFQAGYPGPLPPLPPLGTIPLYNPAQVSQFAAAARPTQPRLLSQRRYPNPL